jgi:aquaporin Z
MTTHAPASTAALLEPRARTSPWHFREYAMEAAELGVFMLSACFVVAALEHPGSPLRQALPSAGVRRLLIGIGMGLTAVALIYSPWGKRSGAHMNPSVTLTFLSLGKIGPRDALMYVLAQFLGASLGVLLARLLLGEVLADAAIRFVTTRPPEGGVVVAFWAEGLISGVLMSVVLGASNSRRFSSFTGVFCGTLVAAYITLEAPLSGMSMNPARTFGSAIVAYDFQHIWLYFVAPPLGMLLAAALYTRAHCAPLACPKLQHERGARCIFCSPLAPEPVSSPRHRASNKGVNHG